MELSFVVLETPRLILKGISPELMNTIFNEMDKAAIQQLLGHRTEQEYEEELAKHLKGYASYNRRFLLFLLMEKESKKIIGRCGLHNMNLEDKRAEIGYIMREESFKSKGFMSEAVDRIIAYGFEEIKLNRIEAMVGINNVPSQKILHRFNFTLEGQLRQHKKMEGYFTDSKVFSLLAEEYLSPEKKSR